MKKNNKKFFIEALEQRIMLDGAGASTFIDTLDAAAHDKFSLNNESKVNKFVESANKDSDVKLPFINQTRDQKRNELKQVVFIDTQVEDYQQLIRSFDKNTEIHLIQSNENGFDKINQTLKGYKNIDSLHIIGHGSAGQILFGDALLSNDTFNQYSKTLKSIGSNLSQSGDILFYGCNIASNERGLSLISKISEITKADIAASDDVTGKGGDWYLEKNIGIIETKNIQVTDYEHSLLQSGVSSIGTYVEEKPNANDFRARSQSGSGQRSSSGYDFVLSLESENVSNAGTLVLDRDDDGNSNVSLNTSNYPVNSYLLFMNDNHSTGERTSKIGQVVFEYEIYGIFVDAADTVAKNNISKSNATYPTSSNSGFNGRTMESFTFYANDTTSSTSSRDWVSIGSDKKTLRIGSKNGNKGDYIRVITASPSSNTAPVAQNDRGVIVEDGTLTVANSANANMSADNWINTTGEHSGDVIHTSLDSRQDTDADSDTLVVSAVRVGGTEGSGTAGTLGQALTGTYGQLTLNANGSYSYVANQDAADVLDAGDTANDVFNYTISDGNGGTDIATITIVILGANDAPVAQNDVGVIDEGQTLSVANGANANVSGSYDADDEHTGDVIHTSLSGSKDADVDGDDTANLVVSAVRVGGTEGSGTAGTVGDALTGTYGQLTLNANGSYSYVASDDISGLRSGQTVTDVFNYTVSDGTATDTATITITILGQGALPVARNDVGLIVEGGTLTVANGANPTLSGSYDATGEHSGDVLTTNSGSHADTDADSDTLVVSAVRVGSSEGSGTAGTLGQALTGTYGQLTLNANGSYSYVANQDAADALDGGDTVNDVFNYTVSDGNEGTDIATITITILGANDAPVAQNDVGVIDEGQTLSVANGANANVSGNYDADDEHTGDVIHTSLAGSKDTDIDGDDTANLVVSAIRVGSTEGSGTAGTVGQALTGSFGALTLNANGSYSYVAATTSGLFSGDTRTDYFNYTVSDGAATDTATLTITILGVGTAPSNDAPVARNDRGVIVEDGTLTVANSANANVSGSYDATGEHTGDVIHTSLAGSKDTDANSDTLTVTSFRTGSSEGNGTAASSMGSALQGTYGQLTLNADGSYSYVANHNDADVLDAGDSANDVFNYTISDGNGGTDIATITIVILGANDAPVAQNDVGVIVEDGTLTVANGANANVTGSYDATGEHSGDVIHTSLAGSKDTDIDGDDTANLVVSAVRVGSSEGNGT
ncbi:VCBS domain-containing protein, partial [Candidatus Pelagibacter sp.]|nr:VCBS domain-containing protein [Candidatus Pelagibacter sp.]